jgi:hypothetical protein
VAVWYVIVVRIFSFIGLQIRFDLCAPACQAGALNWAARGATDYGEIGAHTKARIDQRISGLSRN